MFSEIADVPVKVLATVAESPGIFKLTRITAGSKCNIYIYLTDIKICFLLYIYQSNRYKR